MTEQELEMSLEIYRQKYEVFRHFDNLRRHLPTFTLGAGTLLLAFATGKDQAPSWWSYVVFGLLALFSSFAVSRVRDGITKNHAALVKVAKLIGDTDIPERARHGATWWLSVLLCLFFLLSSAAVLFA